MTHKLIINANSPDDCDVQIDFDSQHTLYIEIDTENSQMTIRRPGKTTIGCDFSLSDKITFE